ncbi:ComEA protein [uncultured Eubacteriales bacterium]|uniref:ComEA protein n=1 Tax=uncultured Eubacteriales bacterium TaxID=172733 RepID=A0A212K8P3_9FIRM|nr:ComEA protein [uncultured Eubacteriales bacterium]
MKISKLEFATLLLTAVFLAFSLGWFLRGSTAAQPVRVETERTLSAAENSPVVLPTPSESAVPIIDINTAAAEELEALPGIGPKRAADIVAYREEHGPFRIPEDIAKVPGIGESTLEGLIDFITTGE